MLSPDDARLLERLHGDLPLTERPFADVAAEFGWTKGIRHWAALGPAGERHAHPLWPAIPDRARGRPVHVLAAMAVPEERYEAVTAQVNAHPEIAHNYRRAHALNMWFVLGTETPAQCAAAITLRIEAETGLPVLAFPKEREFFVELKLPLHQATGAAHGA